MRKFFASMMLLAAVPFAVAATCGNQNPKCLDERGMYTLAAVTKPECKPSPAQPPQFVYPSSTALPTGVLK